MNRKKLNQYFATRIAEEKIPEFNAIQPFLQEKKSDLSGQLRTNFAFYSAFSSLVIVILTASFLYTSTFAGRIAAGYRESNFEPYAQEKISNIERYLSKIRTHKQGGN